MRILKTIPCALLFAASPLLAQEASLGPAPYLDPANSQLWLPTIASPKAVTILTPINIGSKVAVRDAFNANFPALGSHPAMMHTGNISQCTPGAISSAFKEFTISRVNFYRAMAGLPGNVTLDTDATRESQAQSAAVLYSANNGMLSHAPTNPPFTSCSTLITAATAAAGTSNIASSSGNSIADDVVPRYMNDETNGNEQVGHRRWILYPPQASIVVGSTPTTFTNSGANALRVIGGWGARAPTPNGVAWPPAGYVPMQLLPVGKRWSYSFYSGNNQTSFQNATVAVTANGAPIGVSIISQADSFAGFGDNTIVFVPTGTITKDIAYSVTISGITGPGAPATVSYTVRPFDVADPILNNLRGDLNGDGKADLIFQDAGGNIAAWTMNGTGVFDAAGLLPAGSGWSVTHTADFNGDGKTDILLRHTDGRVLMWIMNGVAPSAQINLQPPASGWTVTHTADMNGDGKADIQWQHTDGTVAVWLMNGGTLVAPAVLQGAASGWHITHMADLNGDGKADILWQHTDGTTVAWLMDGLAYLSSAGFTPAGSGWSITGTGDVNGDGKADLVFTKNDGAIMLWVMNGTGLISFAALQNAGTPWRITLIGDLNGDGKADLIWRNTDGSTYASLMNGTATLSAGYLFGAASGWTATQLLDLNGDGKVDILWRFTDGTIATWLMNGLSTVGAAGFLGPSTWQVVPPQ